MLVAAAFAAAVTMTMIFAPDSQASSIGFSMVAGQEAVLMDSPLAPFAPNSIQRCSNEPRSIQPPEYCRHNASLILSDYNHFDTQRKRWEYRA